MSPLPMCCRSRATHPTAIGHQRASSRVRLEVPTSTYQIHHRFDRSLCRGRRNQRRQTTEQSRYGLAR